MAGGAGRHVSGPVGGDPVFTVRSRHPDIVIDAEVKALVDALPGNVWRTDPFAKHIEVDRNLLRLAGLAESIIEDRHWLTAVHDDDLVAGTLIWQPWSATSPVSTASFRLVGVSETEISLKVLVIPFGNDGAPAGWLGCFFRVRPAPNDAEYIAAALLERIAKLTGYCTPRPSTIAPLPLAQHRSGNATYPNRPLAILLGCGPEDVEQLELLLGLLDWRTVVADRVTAELAKAATLIFVGQIEHLPGDISRPFSTHPTVAALIPIGNIEQQKQARAVGCHLLDSPAAIDLAEEIIVASQ